MIVRRIKNVVFTMVVTILACVALLAGCTQASSASKASTATNESTASSSSQVSSTSSASSSSSTSTTSKTSSESTSQNNSSSYITAVDSGDPYASYSQGTHHAIITIEGYDPVTIELDADSAPVSTWNFCKLASEGYYNGKTFYRFVDGFCMQGGTQGNSATGKDNSLDSIVGEFSLNNIDNPLADSFQKGTVAMARSGDPNSARSTFFITLSSDSMVQQSLNGQYAAFGKIDEAGMAIIDQIVADNLSNVSNESSGAISDETKQPVISSLVILD